MMETIDWNKIILVKRENFPGTVEDLIAYAESGAFIEMNFLPLLTSDARRNYLEKKKEREWIKKRCLEDLDDGFHTRDGRERRRCMLLKPLTLEGYTSQKDNILQNYREALIKIWVELFRDHRNRIPAWEQ